MRKICMVANENLVSVSVVISTLRGFYTGHASERKTVHHAKGNHIFHENVHVVFIGKIVQFFKYRLDRILSIFSVVMWFQDPYTAFPSENYLGIISGLVWNGIDIIWGSGSCRAIKGAVASWWNGMTSYWRQFNVIDVTCSPAEGIRRISQSKQWNSIAHLFSTKIFTILVSCDRSIVVQRRWYIQHKAARINNCLWIHEFLLNCFRAIYIFKSYRQWKNWKKKCDLGNFKVEIISLLLHISKTQVESILFSIRSRRVYVPLILFVDHGDNIKCVQYNQMNEVCNPNCFHFFHNQSMSLQTISWFFYWRQTHGFVTGFCGNVRNFNK